MGCYDEAIIAYSQVLHLDPSDGSAAEQRGEALMNAGKYQEAIASYDRANCNEPRVV
jgi:tetratricopeptide (TPR) repeat protein